MVSFDELTTGGHSYRNFDPPTFVEALDQVRSEDDRKAVVSAIHFIEAGRFEPFLDATAAFFTRLDTDERRLFTHRNPNVVQWMSVYNQAHEFNPYTEYYELADDFGIPPTDAPAFERSTTSGEALFKDMLHRRRSYRGWSPYEFLVLVRASVTQESWGEQWNERPFTLSRGEARELNAFPNENLQEMDFPRQVPGKYVGRLLLMRIEAGRFFPVVNAGSTFFGPLDADERESFAQRNPGLAVWLSVYNWLQDKPYGSQMYPSGFDWERLPDHTTRRPPDVDKQDKQATFQDLWMEVHQLREGQLTGLGCDELRNRLHRLADVAAEFPTTRTVPERAKVHWRGAARALHFAARDVGCIDTGGRQTLGDEADEVQASIGAFDSAETVEAYHDVIEDEFQSDKGRPSVTGPKLIADLQRVADELGHVPIRAEYDEHGNWSSQSFVDHFGSFNNGLREAGFDVPYDDRNRRKSSRSEMIADLRRVADELGHVPTGREYEAHGKYTRNTLAAYFGTYNEALSEIGLADRRRNVTYGDSELLDDLRRVGDELGHAPTIAEYKEHGRLSGAVIQDRFGSWPGALYEAGMEPSVGQLKKVDDVTLLLDVIDVAERLGHPPTIEEYEREGTFPVKVLVSRSRFGSWENVLYLAELT